MLKYKNISSYPLTFYNITFNPNEVKSVPGYINHPKMIRVKESKSIKPKAIIEAAKPEAESADVEVRSKRQYNRKNNNK